MSDHDDGVFRQNPVPTDGSKQVDDDIWIPPPRSMRTGHRVAIGPYKPIATKYMNWRWWLAEYPMRILARYMARIEDDRELRGEEYIGEHISTHPDMLP
jgi:hypothetical protein